MANIEKVVTKKYKLELNESEYHAFLSLIGAVPYTNFKDSVNCQYNAMLHGEHKEKLSILTSEQHEELYNKLMDNL